MIILNEDTKCLVQGITGKQGQFHTEQMMKYNTKIVAGVTQAKADKRFVEFLFLIPLKRLRKMLM